MKNEKLKLFNKGKFLPINKSFMVEGHEVLQEVQKIQEKFNKEDTDTFINELRDSIAGFTLGFDLVNIEKHGFDCKKSTEECFLEVKSTSFMANVWQATFNDTTLEKAKAFKDKKVFLALAVWKGASELLFICYGQNENIGNFLESKVMWFKERHTVRSTQSISLFNLVFNYGFKILAVNKSKEEVLSLLVLKNKYFTKLSINDILNIEDYNGVI